LNQKEHWAIFVEGTEIKWTFGDPSVEFQGIVADFLRGLGSFGEELFGEGIASITFDLPKHSGFKSTELFIVSLKDHFYFIISDPSITLMLISAKDGIPFDIKEIMTAVLVGQASVLYASSIEETDQADKDRIHKELQDIILDVNPSYAENDQVQIIVGNSGSNFGILSFEECLLFHYFLRKQAEEGIYFSPSSWCLISHQDGGDIPFSFNIEDYGKTFFMALDKSFMLDLLLTRKFQSKFFETGYWVIKDLSTGIKELIIEEILNLSSTKLSHLSAESLLDKYIGETTETMMFSFGDGEENSDLLRDERIDQVLRVWGRYLADL